jgi:hypothetical protein
MSARLPADPLSEIARLIDLDQRIAALEFMLAGFRAQREAEALEDAREAGDVDADGEPVAYAKYRSAS